MQNYLRCCALLKGIQVKKVFSFLCVVFVQFVLLRSVGAEAVRRTGVTPRGGKSGYKGNKLDKEENNNFSPYAHLTLFNVRQN